MKSTDLMIGDWVKSPHNSIAQIVEIVCEETNDEKFEYFVTLSDTFDFHISEIFPIPLTTEILKNNGIVFKHGLADNSYAVYYGEIEDFFITIQLKNKSNQIDVLVEKGDYSIIRVWNVEYVHQLQHALKLCGIEKEIVL